MTVTLQEVLVRTLKKLEESSFKRFVEKLSVLEVNKEYIKIPKDEMTGKDSEHVAGLIYEYYGYAYGAEVTLDVLEDIDEKKVREELQQDLREVDTSNDGLGTAKFTDRVTFIDRHRSDLIRDIRAVYPVLCDLWDQQLLTEEEYNEVMEKRTSQEKIETLCDIIRYWEDAGKYKAYTTIKRCEPRLIYRLELYQENIQKFTFSENRLHFIDKHRLALISRITDVDPVLRDLRDQELLTEEQYNVVMSGRTSQEKMEELYKIMNYWEVTGKRAAYELLKKYNQKIIEDLIGPIMYHCAPSIKLEHFVDEHRRHLITNIKEVTPVLDDLRSNNLLTGKDFTRLQAMTSPEEKMSGLRHILLVQSDTVKDQFFISLWRYNYKVIHNFEKSFRKTKFGSLFIDRHREDLIHRIKVIPPVIEDLLRNHRLIREESDYILGIPEPEHKMRRLYEITGDSDQYNKADVYCALNKYNNKVIDDLKRIDEASKLLQRRIREESKMSLKRNRMKVDELSCELCDQFHQETVEAITPSLIGSTYHLSIPSPGLFRCSKSGIQFQVTQPVTIEYEVDSWSNYTEILQNLRGGYQIIGPLFNIRSSLEPNVVSAVYLPHCLCLGGYKEDKSLIRCFHYKDDNFVLEAPSRMEAMYAVLENPTFSCIGVLLYPLTLIKEAILKLIPYHGMVLLFCNTITREDLTHKYRLHLYLLPRILTVAQAVERFERSFSFLRILKAPQTKSSVYSQKNYRINGPQIASVIPRTLLFETHCPSKVYSFTEISIEGGKNTQVKVTIHPENEDIEVWETDLSAEEMFHLPYAKWPPTDQPEEMFRLPYAKWPPPDQPETSRGWKKLWLAGLDRKEGKTEELQSDRTPPVISGYNGTVIRKV